MDLFSAGTIFFFAFDIFRLSRWPYGGNLLLQPHGYYAAKFLALAHFCPCLSRSDLRRAVFYPFHLVHRVRFLGGRALFGGLVLPIWRRQTFLLTVLILLVGVSVPPVTRAAKNIFSGKTNCRHLYFRFVCRRLPGYPSLSGYNKHRHIPHRKPGTLCTSPLASPIYSVCRQRDFVRL